LNFISGLRSALQRVGILPPVWPNIGPRTFLLWEPSSKSHAEVVPGYVRYLRDLGFQVLVLMTPAMLSEGLFSRYQDPGVTYARLSQADIRNFIKTADLSGTAGLLVTTAGKLPKTAQGAIDVDMILGRNRPPLFLLVEHDARAMIDDAVWNSRYITLRDINYKGCTSTVINPHYFGEVGQASTHNGQTRFLMVGAARARRGNHQLVYDTALKLLQAGQSSFVIRVVGKRGSFKVPDELESHVQILGRLSYDRLYEEVENSDFIVTSFQKQNEKHEFYYTGGTSGSFQLAYGFGKPVVVQKDIAGMCHLNDENSILYDDDKDMLGAMMRATTMERGDYDRMASAMRDTASMIYGASLDNMNKLING
jgi:hypothetical protein